MSECDRQINKAMTYHPYGLSLGDSVRDNLAVTAKFLKDIGKIEHIPAWNEAIDPRYLQKLKDL